MPEDHAGSDLAEIVGAEPYAQAQLRGMWTYSNGGPPVKAFRLARDASVFLGDSGVTGAAAGSWVVVDPVTGRPTSVLSQAEFSARPGHLPIDIFKHVPDLPTYLGTVNGPDGTPLIDLLLDRNPFMLDSGPGHSARPHVLMTPRQHRDGWSSATAAELRARDVAMHVVSEWYRTLDGGIPVFAANDSAPNLDFTDPAPRRPRPATATKNPRQEVQHAHLHAFFAEGLPLINNEATTADGPVSIAAGQWVYPALLDGDAVTIPSTPAAIGPAARRAASAWNGSYCSYQLGVDGPLQVMPALGSSQDQFNQLLATADGLTAGPDSHLGGRINLHRPSLSDPPRSAAAMVATAHQRQDFTAFLSARGLNPRALSQRSVAARLAQRGTRGVGD